MTITIIFHRIPVAQFYFSMILMYLLGYPLANTALLGATSKIFGNSPQGAGMVSIESLSPL